MSTCQGNIKDDHCCWINGKVCKFLKHYPTEKRIWSCGIREKYNSWEETYQDLDYIKDVKPILDEIDIPDCGDWPRPNEQCAICGVIG
jgi:hypothetical protein